jgi:hypothetical protein
MKPRHLVIIFILAMIALAGCVTQVSERWRLYDAGPFSFSMPSSLAPDASMHEIDSYARWFTNADMHLSFDYGAYSDFPLDDELGKKTEYSSHVESIAGRKVQIASFDSDAEFPGRFKYNIVASYRYGLTMQVACATKSDYDKALRIFRSVKFKKNYNGPYGLRFQLHAMKANRDRSYVLSHVFQNGATRSWNSHHHDGNFAISDAVAVVAKASLFFQRVRPAA